MRRSLLTLLILVSSIFAPSAHIQAIPTAQSPTEVNLLVNSSFEDGTYEPMNAPDGWTRGSTGALTWDNTVAHSGTMSVKISATVSMNTHWQQDVLVDKNTI